MTEKEERAAAWLRQQPRLFLMDTEPEALAFQASVVSDLEPSELLGVVAEVQQEARVQVGAWLVGFQARGGVVVHEYGNTMVYAGGLAHWVLE